MFNLLSFKFNFLSFEERRTDEKWNLTDCTNFNSPESSECLSTHPLNRNILNTLNKKIAEMEIVLTFNGNMIEDMQTTIKILMEKNKNLKSEQAVLKERIKQLEKEITDISEKTFKEETAKIQLSVTLKRNIETEENVKKVFALTIGK